ncbi:MAG: hypothetical protein KDA89_24300, partial [Planctomycetaceae bacterium]|nr:hypothetical protein [Planctomycetaceae bacterium]
MMFSSRPTRRQSSRTSAVAAGILQTEICEQRLVLTPSVITPTGNFQTLTDTAGQNFTPEIQWTAEPAAVSYDLWVSSLESYDTVFVQRGMTDTFYPTDGLPLGKLRIWVRANFADSTSTPWSVSAQPINVTPPNDVAVDGATGTRHIVNDNTPTVTWNSPDLAHRFQIWLTDLSHNVSPRLYLVDNLTPTLDADGNEVLDADGNTIPQEIRSFEIPDQLEIGRYRIWVRAFDQSARNTAWSSSYTFDVGPAPTNLTPAAPTFQDSPVLGWDSVAGATHYEVYLSDAGSTTAYFRRTVAADTTAARQSAQIIRSVAGTPIVENGNDTVENTERPRLDSSGNEVPFYLPDGSYDFWVRAIYRDTTSTSNPVIYGAWTAATRFSTLVAPTITGPVADNGVVTDPTPTVEWSAIDGAARYQIYVHRFNTRPPFLEAESSVNSYTFETSLPADTYYVWVRAIDTRGNFSPWSAPYQIVSTGGAPLILTPTANTAVRINPTYFEWL